MKIRKVRETGLSVVERSRMPENQYLVKKLLEDSLSNSSPDSNGYMLRGSDYHRMKETLSQHFSITSDTIDQNLSRLCDLEVAHWSRSGNHTLNPFPMVSANAALRNG